MSFLENSAAFTLVVSVCGYVALQIMLLVRSIQAIVGKDGLCTDASFRWVWFICISSALYANSLIQNRARILSVKSVEEGVLVLVITVICCLSFALATQFQYLDGCPAGQYAHLTMKIYMWGNYAVVAAIVLVTSLLRLDAWWINCRKRSTPSPAAVV